MKETDNKRKSTLLLFLTAWLMNSQALQDSWTKYIVQRLACSLYKQAKKKLKQIYLIVLYWIQSGSSYWKPICLLEWSSTRYYSHSAGHQWEFWSLLLWTHGPNVLHKLYKWFQHAYHPYPAASSPTDPCVIQELYTADVHQLQKHNNSRRNAQLKVSQKYASTHPSI